MEPQINQPTINSNAGVPPYGYRYRRVTIP